MHSTFVYGLKLSVLRGMGEAIATDQSEKQQQKGKNRTRDKIKLCFLSELFCLLFKLKLIFKPAILIKFIHFQLCIQNKKLGFLVVPGVPHILTL